MTVGQNITRLREALGWTQAELADRVAMQQGRVSAFEREKRLPTPQIIKRFADALKCQPADLLVGVITPYDTLREGTVPVPAHHGEKLTPDEKRVLTLWRGLDPVNRKLAVQLLQSLQPKS